MGKTDLAGIGSMLAGWSERWMPDAFVFALLAVIVVFVAGLVFGSPASDLVRYFGEGFWSLIPFTMQMVMIVVGGYVVASSAPIHHMICRLASLPKTPRGAIAFVALVSTTTSLISYGLSLIVAAFLAREIARRMEKVDYRALAAAAYLGLGSVWALGLSSSAALMMATQGSVPPALFKISGLIPLSQTIYTWQNGVTALVLIAVSVSVAYWSAPTGPAVRTAESLGVTLDAPNKTLESQQTPGEWLEYAPVLTIPIVLLGFAYLMHVIATKGLGAALDLNTYNLLFLMLGLLLHWTPRSFTRSVSAAVPTTAGILVQFPFYAGIFGMISFSPIAHRLAEAFTRVSSQHTYPLIVSLYSVILGFFVPSGGGKWLIEAPYILAAARDLKVNLGWTVQMYNAAEALPNLINPFWMLPMLGIMKLKARDVVGYGLLQFLVNLPIVFFLMWLFARTLLYVSPIVNP
jgi:short-chain fatty acids transporter